MYLFIKQLILLFICGIDMNIKHYGGLNEKDFNNSA